MDGTLPLSLIVAVTLLSVAVLGFKNKILFKMGVRNFSRRPKETVIVVIGLLVSTAIISGSLIAGETVNYIIEKATYDALGTVDETVAAGGQNFFNYALYEKLTSDSNVTSRIIGISPAISDPEIIAVLTSNPTTTITVSFGRREKFLTPILNNILFLKASTITDSNITATMIDNSSVPSIYFSLVLLSYCTVFSLISFESPTFSETIKPSRI